MFVSEDLNHRKIKRKKIKSSLPLTFDNSNLCKAPAGDDANSPT